LFEQGSHFRDIQLRVEPLLSRRCHDLQLGSPFLSVHAINGGAEKVFAHLQPHLMLALQFHFAVADLRATDLKILAVTSMTGLNQ